MKKQVLLTAALCSFTLGTVNAQLQTNRSESVVGFNGAEALENGNKRLILTFNTTKGYTDGSEGSNKINCNSLKGLAGAALTTEGLTNNVAAYLDNYHWMKGTNQGAKFKRYKDVASLIAAHTVGETLVSTDHRYWKCGNILMDIPETNGKDQAWAVWPGINKRTVMMISFNGSDGIANLCKDIELDLMTLDKGTTGKTSSYKMIVITGQNSINLGELGKACGKEGNDVALLDSINENNVAAVNTPDARSIAIKPWDKSMFRVIEKAIIDSDLGIMPENNGEIIRIGIPPLTEERRKQLAKQCKAEGETAKVSVRNARRDGIDTLKKAVKEGLAEDEQKNAEAKLQKIHDKYIKQIDDMLAEKDKEIMTV